METKELEIEPIKTIETEYIKKRGRPKKDDTLRGSKYYNAKKEDISKQKKEYYQKHLTERKEYYKKWYANKREEEYKALHNGSLDGFKPIKLYNKFSKTQNQLTKNN